MFQNAAAPKAKAAAVAPKSKAASKAAQKKKKQCNTNDININAGEDYMIIHDMEPFSQQIPHYLTRAADYPCLEALVNVCWSRSVVFNFTHGFLLIA